MNAIVAGALLASALAPAAVTATGNESQARLTKDLADARPVVIHVVVALCDNINQGIVPVSEKLGNGQDVRSNLYWGALYGVRTHLTQRGGWSIVESSSPQDERIIERAILFQTLKRADSDVPVFIVADAWDGAHIKSALRDYLDMAAGLATEAVDVQQDSQNYALQAGGSAHMVVYVGHNGLMDFSLSASKPQTADRVVNSAIVLACASKPYFLDLLRTAQSHPLLLTTGLMAPEAYTLDAALKSWVAGGSSEAVREAAAAAYDQYQNCGIDPARRLFWSAP
jgi:hypothetical protein